MKEMGLMSEENGFEMAHSVERENVATFMGIVKGGYGEKNGHGMDRIWPCMAMQRWKR